MLIYKKNLPLGGKKEKKYSIYNCEGCPSFKFYVFMGNRNQHVVPKGDQWAIKGAGTEKVTKIVQTQTEAIKIAREIAINQKSELIIHRPNGQIREKNTYGDDNFPPAG